ncbi:HAUS3 [Bugula neritina]|uniref:HAUS3 n=1 Tax=Bugula neritina TaxID=10212 RepID=A0A7J7JUY5_BUGNE|nr:HAUS3 [Bugula neritina]
MSASRSSHKFDLLLSKLNIPHDKRPNEEADKEWLWADPDCATLLDYLINNVNRSNLVTPAENMQYKYLSQERKVLSGRHLTEALETCSEETDLNEETLDEKIASLSQLSDSLTAKKSRLKLLSSNLNKKICSLELETENMEKLNTREYKNLSSQLDDCEHGHLDIKKTLTELVEVIGKLHHMYTVGDTKSSKLLCQTDLENLYQAEESYTASLAEFTDKRFFEGVSDIAGDHDESYYQLVDISNPQLLTLKQEKDESLVESCKEMKRLRQLQSSSLQQSVEAQVNYAKCEAACKDIEVSGKEVEDMCHLSIEQLRKHLERLRGQLAIHSKELAAKDADLNLLKETYILTGDYNLKLARQQYFQDCQQQVISKLVDQRARNEMLTLMLEVEMEEIQKVRHILASITAYLQQLASSGKHRLAVLEEAEMISSQYSRTVVDSRDGLLSTIDKITDEKDGKEKLGKVFTSYKEVIGNVNNLLSLHKEKTTTNTLAEHQLSDMKQLRDDCLEELLLTSSDNVSLLPADITKGAAELKVQLRIVESSIKTIMSIISQKKKLLSQR